MLNGGGGSGVGLSHVRSIAQSGLTASLFYCFFYV